MRRKPSRAPPLVPAAGLLLWLVADAALATFLHAEPRECLFIHGSGQTGFSPPTVSFKDYWGDIDAELVSAGICNSTLFNHVDSVHFGWDNDTLARAVCDFATAGAHNGSLVGANKLVFTHSMGNLYFANALQRGLCRLDNATPWISLSSPSRGSKAADFSDDLCRKQSSLSLPLREVLQMMGVCDASTSTPNAAYVSMRSTYPPLQATAKFLHARVDAALCGTSAWGLNSHYSPELKALSEFVDFGEQNDGMVGISSCLIPGKPYSKDVGSGTGFYTPAINHADATCRNGNGDFGKADRQPCTYFLKAAARFALAKTRSRESRFAQVNLV